MNSNPILYVEDEETDVILLQHVLKQIDVQNQLLTVADGQTAIDYLSGQGQYADHNRYPRPCLVLLDLNLPRKSGLEVLRWIRQNLACYTLPVVVLTSSRNEADVHRSYAFGANAYLVKPARIDRLKEMVRALKDFWLNTNQMPPDCAEFEKPQTVLK